MTTDEEINFGSLVTSPSSTSFNLDFSHDKEPQRRDDRRRKIWKNDQMEAALAAIRNREMGYHKASKHFGVPRTTLFRLSKRDNDSTETAEKGSVLSSDMEEILINHLLQMEQEHSGLTREDVKRIICDFAEETNILNPFESDTMTGKRWLKQFLKRHAGRLSLRKTTELPALNCVDLFPNPPKYIEKDAEQDQSSKDKTFADLNVDSNESIPKSVENEQDLINQFIDDDNSNDSLDKFEKELETEKDHPEVTEEDIEKIAEPEAPEKVSENTDEIQEVQKITDTQKNTLPNTYPLESDTKKETANQSELHENSNSGTSFSSEGKGDVRLEDKILQKASASLPASSPSLSISSYYSSGDSESVSSLSSHKKKKKKRHCHTCDTHFRHTQELLNHLKTHVTLPSVTVIKLSDADERVQEYLQREGEPKEPEELGSLKLKLKLSGTQNFEVVKSPTEKPKNKGIRILTAKEIKQSPPHNTEIPPIDAMVAMSEMPLKPVDDSALENRYFECPTLDGLDQYATDEVQGEATEDLLKKLLESGQQIHQETDWSSNTNEFISIDRLAHMCTVCHCNFPDAVQLYEHKRITGHDIQNTMQPPAVPPLFMQQNNFRHRINFPPNHMSVGGYQHSGPHMGPVMRPAYTGYAPQRFSPIGPSFGQQPIIARRPPPLYRGPSPQSSPSPGNPNQFSDLNSDIYSPHSNGMLGSPTFPNNQMQHQIRQPVFLKTRLQRAIRPRTPLQNSSPNGTPSPPIVMAPPTAVRPRFLGPLYTPPLGPPSKRIKREPDDDCEIVSQSPRMDGLPVIQSVQGGVPQPQITDKTKESPVQLNDQITLSLKNKELNKNPKEVASILANRGITVTHKTKQGPVNETSPKGGTSTQEAVQKLQLNNSVSIISKKKPDGIEESAISKLRSGDSSFISCPFADCEEKFLTVEGLNRHTQRGHRMNKVNLKAFRCKICPALFSTHEGLMDHQRKNHRMLKTSADELGIPIIDLRNEQTKQKLASLGIINYIPLNSKTANGCFGFPIVSVQGAANPNVCNMMGLGVNSLLSLGPIKPIPSRKNDS